MNDQIAAAKPFLLDVREAKEIAVIWKIGHGVGLNRGHEAPLMQAGEMIVTRTGPGFAGC